MVHEERFLERIEHANPSDKYRTNADPKRVARSVLEHLMRVLNSRQGSVPIAPDYGLPDFNDLVTRMPDSIMELKREIKKCIEKYEPRLSRVKVNYVQDEDNPLNLRYEITAQLVLDDGKSDIWFETTLDSSGQVRVRG
ncbi:MAG: type VI secretion system baseplate subunit TssE [Gammaproteobacteria bacterium]|nr:type VI secretion system baseplate subunit TssE [Gammaproteobacteria bacterium]